MSPLLSWTNHGKVPLSSSFSTSMNSSDNWMKFLVETMEEFISLSSSTPRPTMGYDNYLTLLQDACIRYDSTHTSKSSLASRAAYKHELSPDQHDNPYTPDYSSSGTTYGGIDMPAEEFYQVHTTNLNRPPSVSTITPRKPTPSPSTG